ncbi:uncharacterized protein LOC126983463 [Eriocheir sinensis]|uniref:uncharacterized protein LOC126983463 n=1 Tax=Eriocheir sinensis TaxID=95602 RepID=UPI0021C8E571|nr:uncharacterized protein LOC126983463 [Eriocheir sinensis]
MRTSARARIKCLVGLVVAVGLVSLLSPLPFTSSTPRLIGLNPTRPQTTLNPIQRRGEEKRSEISERTGEHRQSKVENRDNRGNTGKFNEDTGVYDKKPGENEGNFGNTGKYKENNENLSGKHENLNGNDKLVKYNEDVDQKSGNTGGKDGTIGEGSGRSTGKQNKANSKGKTSGNKRENNENQDKSSVEKGSIKSRVKNEEEEEEEEEGKGEVDLSREPYIENIPPAEWVEVKKTNPKERGGGGGGGGLKGETEKGKNGEGGKKLNVGENGGSKEGKGGGKGGKRRWLKGTWKAGQGDMKPTGLSHTELQKRAESLPESSPVRAFLAEQRRRVSHVAESCRSFQTSLAEVVAGSRGPPVGLLAVRDIIYDRMNQLTFCPVYKAASTSLTITLLQLAGHWTPRTQTQPVQKLVKMFYPKLSGLAAPSITANTTHFMVVRHPLERLLSCYRDKFQLASKDYYYHIIGEKVVRRYRQALQHMPKDEVMELQQEVIYMSQYLVMELQQEVRQALRKHRNQYGEDAGAGDFLKLPHNPFANPVGPTFPEFAQHVADTKHDDEHWRSYTAHCAPCTLTYDIVLRFESLKKETELFLEYLDRRGEVIPRWDNPNKKAETGAVFCQYYSQLPLALIDRLVDKYRRDLIMFEYDVEDYRKCAKEYQRKERQG